MLIKISIKIFNWYDALYIHRYILSVLKHCSGTPCYYDMVSPLCPKSAWKPLNNNDSFWGKKKYKYKFLYKSFDQNDTVGDTISIEKCFCVPYQKKKKIQIFFHDGKKSIVCECGLGC